MIVVWRVTERCNLRCPFCAYDRTLARSRRTADPEAIRAFGSVLAEYQRQTGDPVLVSWLGGEPLRWPELPALAAYFHHTLGLRQSATTNGTTLHDPAARRHLAECYDELTISVDAMGESHDRLRGWPGGFAALRTGVRSLAAEPRPENRPPLWLRANVVLMCETIAGFSDLCLELATWGIREITFNQLGGADRPEFYPAHRLLPEQVAQFGSELPTLRARLAASGVRLSGTDEYLLRFSASARNERLPVADCHPGQRFLFVNELGMVSPCSFTGAIPGVPLAELRTVPDLLGLPLRFTALRRTHLPTACEDCQSTQVFAKFAA